MSDIVKQLHEYAINAPTGFRVYHDAANEITRLRAELAAVTEEREKFKQILISESKKVGELQLASIDNLAEITRLRAENEKLREENDAWQMDGASCANEVKYLRAENKRLREALKETLAIASRNEAGGYIDRARAALEGVTEKEGKENGNTN